MTRSSTVPLGVQFNQHKAGIAADDAGRIAKTVEEAARGGRFFANEERKDAVLTQRVEEARKAAESAPAFNPEVERLVSNIEAERDSSPRSFLCIDFDCFYAAVEALDNPSLRGKPHAVGGPVEIKPHQRRRVGGVLSTSSYEARKYGVRSAMPTFIALKLCPELIIVPARYQRYTEISQLVATEVYTKFDPNYVMRSLDEALLDITDFVERSGSSAAEVATTIRLRIKEVTGGLTASCGIGPSRVLAKICADFNKPDGQYMVPSDRDSVVEFMSNLPVRKVPGVGKVTERLLVDAFDVKVAGDILVKRNALHRVLSAKMFAFLVRSALGISCPFLEPDQGQGQKGMSRERTFEPVSDPVRLRELMQGLCERLAKDIAEADGVQGGYHLSIKIKLSNFRVLCRSRKLQRIVGTDAKRLAKEASQLLDAELPFEARLLGVRVSGLVAPGERIPMMKRRYIGASTADTTGDGRQTFLDAFLAEGLSLARKDRQQLTGATEEEPTDHETGAIQGECTRDDVHATAPESQPDMPAADPGPPALAPAGELVCPVCNSKRVRGLTLLNTHIDACLRKQQRGPVAGKRSRSDAEIGMSEKHASRRRRCDITAYFRTTNKL